MRYEAIYDPRTNRWTLIDEQGRERPERFIHEDHARDLARALNDRAGERE